MVGLQRFNPLVLSIGLLVATVTGLGAQTALERQLGPLAGFVEMGQDETWSAASEQGWFMLRNTSDPGAVRYYWVEPPQTSAGAYRINLNLALRPLAEAPVFGGVLFNFRSGSNYMGVLIGSDGGAYVLVRNDNGFNLQPVDGPRPRGDGSDIIAATVQGGRAQFTLNGDTLLSMENDRAFSPQLGILAVGAGQFGYTDFAVDTLQ